MLTERHRDGETGLQGYKETDESTEIERERQIETKREIDTGRQRDRKKGHIERERGRQGDKESARK